MNSWLGQTDQTELAGIISYHIVPAKLFASNLSGKPPTKTLSGAELTFTDANGVKVNGSGLLARNIEATNGVVHALDAVLMPPAAAMAATAATANVAATAAPSIAAVTPPTTQADGHSDAPAATAEPAPAAATTPPATPTLV